MRKADNPFEPGAGTKPPELVGRDVIIDDALTAVAKGSKGRVIRSQIFYGLRGVGKTVLLRAITARAIAEENALVADLETPEDKPLAELIAPALRKILLSLSTYEQAKSTLRTAYGALQAFAAKFEVKLGDLEVGVRPPQGVADSGDFAADLSDLIEAVGAAAKSEGRPVILALDEMQYLKVPEFAALIAAMHRVNQKSLPIGLFGAGLPQILGLAGDAKSYAERLFQFVEIGPLSPPDADRALSEPIAHQGASIDQAAVDFIVQRSQGYPYFLQEWGFRTWNCAAQSPITRSDAWQAEISVVPRQAGPAVERRAGVFAGNGGSRARTPQVIGGGQSARAAEQSGWAGARPVDCQRHGVRRATWHGALFGAAV
jgi:AAA ATPase domain